MKARYNENYKIIESVRLNKNEELVIGYYPEHPITSYRYVCWYYNKEYDSYFWGDYTDTKENAQKSLESRKSSLISLKGKA